MAIFTTLVTATKLLVKNMAKKKLKEKAKKFITGGKDKDKDKDKEKKRAKLKRMIGGAADIATVGMFTFCFICLSVLLLDCWFVKHLIRIGEF